RRRPRARHARRAGHDDPRARRWTGPLDGRIRARARGARRRVAVARRRRVGQQRDRRRLDRPLRHRSTAREVAAVPRGRQRSRCVRAHRAVGGLRRGVAEGDRHARRRWLAPQRAKAVHHERAIAYGRARSQFGRSILEFEAIRLAIAQARAEIDAARLLAHRAARLRDLGEPFTREASMAKLYASEMTQRVTYSAMQLFGGYGYMSEYDIERYARDARATPLYEGTSEVQRMVIARSLLAA